MKDVNVKKTVFELSFSEMVEELKKDKGKMFQPQRAKDGVAIVCDQRGVLLIESYEKDKFSTVRETFIVNVSHIGTARYREVFNKDQLFEER